MSEEIPKTIRNILGQRTLPIAHEKVLLMFAEEVREYYRLDEDRARKACTALKQKYREDPLYFFKEEGFDAEEAESIYTKAAGVRNKQGIEFRAGNDVIRACSDTETIEDLIMKHTESHKKSKHIESEFYELFRKICDSGSNIPGEVKYRFFETYLSLPPTDKRAEAMIYNNQAGILDKAGKTEEALKKTRKAIAIQERVYRTTGDSLDETYLRMYKTNEINIESVMKSSDLE